MQNIPKSLDVFASKWFNVYLKVPRTELCFLLSTLLLVLVLLQIVEVLLEPPLESTLGMEQGQIKAEQGLSTPQVLELKWTVY